MIDCPLQSADADADAVPAARFIGVFDSGVGGLSVLRALRGAMPRARLVYFADSGHAPYGERGEAHILHRAQAVAGHLVKEGAAGLVVACNTATAVAVRTLRERWSELAIVGVEPGLKPAAALTRNGRIGVLATPGTLASDKFRALVQAQAPHLTIVPRACPGLARLIEDGDLDAPALREAIRNHTAALRDAGVDTVVLGCTHYPFVRHHIEHAVGPDVVVVDTAEAVARHAATRFAGLAARDACDAPVRLLTTGDADRLRRTARHWLPFDLEVQAIAA